MEETTINAEVISVFPDKVKIAINDLENFQIAEEKLRVGSYIRIADNDDSNSNYREFFNRNKRNKK